VKWLFWLSQVRSFTMLSPVTRFSYAAAAILLVQSSLACRCSVPTDIITPHFMQIADAVGRFYVHTSISPITGIDGSLYYVATADTWFKGDIGKGKLIVKTSASGSECGATVTVRAFSILFGRVSYEVVPGYAGTFPTLTIDSCKPQKVAKTLSKREWDTIFNYKKSVVCAPTSCDRLQKPVPAILPGSCLPGTKYAETAVCQGQDNGSCGWTVNATCTKLPDPDVCFERHCDGLDKPMSRVQRELSWTRPRIPAQSKRGEAVAGRAVPSAKQLLPRLRPK
jgi:hypothetical protein